MVHYYKIGLTLGLLALPFLVLLLKNRFDDRRKTAFRFALAIVAVWGYLLASRLAVDTIDLWLAKTPEETQAIFNGDGAKNVFALFFGWVPGVLLAFVSWLAARGYRWLQWRAHKVSENTDA